MRPILKAGTYVKWKWSGAHDYEIGVINSVDLDAEQYEVGIWTGAKACLSFQKKLKVLTEDEYRNWNFGSSYFNMVKDIILNEHWEANRQYLTNLHAIAKYMERPKDAIVAEVAGDKFMEVYKKYCK